jgi:hypothetical protein
MQMSFVRRLAEATGSWLHMEFCCSRGGLMNESALKGAIGQVLSAFPTVTPGARVHSDIHHTALTTGKAGAKRCVDFVVAKLPVKGWPSDVEIAIETKWAGSTHCSPSNIGHDFVRLAMIKRADPTAHCLFILAGTATNIEKTLSRAPFTKGVQKNAGIPSDKSQRKTGFDNFKSVHKTAFGEAINDWQALGKKVPRSITTNVAGAYPEQNANGTVRFQAIAWEVLAADPHNITTVW